MSLAKGFSQVYILITLIAEIISFIVRILLSVRLAVSSRSFENTLPIQPNENKYLFRKNKFF
jgi:hypothetical protein